MLQKLKDYLNSPEFKVWVKEEAKRKKDKEKRLNEKLERFHVKYGDKLDLVLEKLMNKYYSDEYVKREYHIGYQPREELLWFVFEYAQRYCKPCKNKKYFNMFTGEAYYVGSYVMQIMYGQGAILKIDKKIKNK